MLPRHRRNSASVADDNNNNSGLFPCRCASSPAYSIPEPTIWHTSECITTICYTCRWWVNILAMRHVMPQVNPTYAANGQAEAHSVEHCGGDCAVVERVLDAVVVTEKAPLIGADLTQVKGRQGQTSCGRRDQGEEVKRRKESAGAWTKCWDLQICLL